MVFYHQAVKYFEIFGKNLPLWETIFFLAILVASLFAFLYTKQRKLDYFFMLKLIFLVDISIILFSLVIPRLGMGSLSSFLGIFAGLFVALVFVRVAKKDYVYIDILSLSMLLGIAIGRVGCFFNWCCKGVETTLPWGVIVGGHPPVHPTQIYSIILSLVLFGLFFLFRNNKFFVNNPGNMALSIFASYSFFRLTLIEPLRIIVVDTSRSLTLSLIFSVSLLILYIRNRK